MQTTAADMSTGTASASAAIGANGHLNHNRHNSMDRHTIAKSTDQFVSEASNGRLDELGDDGEKAGRPNLVEANLHSSEEDTGLGLGDDDDIIEDEDEDDGDEGGQLEFTPAVVTTPLDEVPSLASSTTFTSWGLPTGTSVTTRSRGSMVSSNGDPILTPASSIMSSAGLMGSLNSSLAGIPSQGTFNSSSIMNAPTGVSNSTPARPGGPVHLQRPHAIRTPSNAYAPFVARRPSQFPGGESGPTRQRTSSVTRRQHLNPNAEYRAQEKAYMQRIRQDAQRAEAEEEGVFLGNLALNTTATMDFSSDDGSGSGGLGPDDVAAGPGSPLSASATAIGAAGDVLDEEFEQDTLLYYGNDDMQPTVEELKIPENRERIEWHTMLASVLTGDVVNQEKKRLIGSSDQPLRDETVKEELWLGLRARCHGRTLQAQRRNVERGRSEVNGIIDSVIGFEVRGSSEAGGKNATQQVEEIMKKIEKMESMYINHAALRAAHPRIGSPNFTASMSSSTAALGGSSTSDQPTGYAASYEAIVAWHNTMKLIETELNVLRKWVGNDELNFSKARTDGQNSTSITPMESDPNRDRLADESSFVDRILKEEGLKSLQNHEGLLVGLSKVINQAKKTLITHADAFSARHLPPYLEELQTLINFPSRLAKEIIRIRVSYAKKIKDLSTQPVMTTEQMIGQFQILLNLAIHIKDTYNKVSRPESGWDPPDCLEENFDTVVLEALKFYFKLLNWKLTSNKNAFKEAEVMEQEWEFSTRVGRLLEGGDVEVAEQFSSLTSKSLIRLNAQFEKELQKRPEDLTKDDVDKLYKTMLDSVRVRQRKLFRFSRILTQRFENCAEYNLNRVDTELIEFHNALVLSGHFLVQSEHIPRGYYIVGSPVLENRPQEVQSMLTTFYHPEEVAMGGETSPYVLILRPENPLHWAGSTMSTKIKPPVLDLGVGRLRLVADGSQQRLANAKMSFIQSVGIELPCLNEQRASLPRVNAELKRIKKTAFNLSNAIMSSVEIIRNQTRGLGCQELIQTCFAFATEFGQRSITYMDPNRRALNSIKLLKLALDWIGFICDDCNPTDRKTFRWAVVALEFAMIMTQGQNLLSLTDGEYSKLRGKVAGCMSLLVSHFDIMGARSTVAAQLEKARLDKSKTGGEGLGLAGDDESAASIERRRLESVEQLDDFRLRIDMDRAQLGKVLEDSNEAVRALTYLSASSSSVHMRWQQGQFIGGGTFGSVYAAINLDTNELMAVKEIRLHDPQMIPTIVAQIRDEMNVLQVLDHPNVVSYYGIEPHRDKVYLFMEYCDGGSLAALLEHGRIEDETVTIVYALQMVEGLAYLHARGVVHRDIKPENTLLDHDGVIKFVDFGAAKVIARQTGKTLAMKRPAPSSFAGRIDEDASMLITSPNDEFAVDPTSVENDQSTIGGPGAIAGGGNSLQGTPMYMSPEVIRGTSPGRLGSSDIWSLGCVILEMVTGRRPWAHLDNEWAIMYNIAQGNTPQLPNRDQLSDSGIKFLERCFEHDPAKRASAAELLQDVWIKELKSQLSLEPPTPGSDWSSSGMGSNWSTSSLASGTSRHNSMA